MGVERGSHFLRRLMSATSTDKLEKNFFLINVERGRGKQGACPEFPWLPEGSLSRKR